MSRYFFHFRHVSEVLDEAGVELASPGAAKCYAVRAMAELLCDEPQTFWDSEEFHVTVADADGLVLFTVEMTSVLSPALGSVTLG